MDILGFPAFYDQAENESRKTLQLELWEKVVRNYCFKNKVFTITIKDTPIFRNKAIGKEIGGKFGVIILKHLSENGLGTVFPEDKGKFAVFTEPPTEFNLKVHKFVLTRLDASKDKSLKFSEMFSAEALKDTEFQYASELSFELAIDAMPKDKGVQFKKKEAKPGRLGTSYVDLKRPDYVIFK